MVKTYGVIPGWILCVIAFALVVYSVVAEMVGFYLLWMRTPETSVVNHRLKECLFLWMFICMGVGWLVYKFRKPGRYRLRVWPVIVVPLVVGGWLAGVDAVRFLDAFSGPGVAGVSFVRVFSVLFLLVYMLGPAVGLWGQACYWRRLALSDQCVVCDYDLTGNESGVCPECGALVCVDRPVPKEIVARKNRWLPELELFETVEDRETALAGARKQLMRGWGAWVQNGGILILLGLLCEARLCGRGWPYQYGVMAVMGVWGIMIMVCWRRGMRAALRKQWEERGKSVDG